MTGHIFSPEELNLIGDINDIAMRNAVNSFSDMLKDELLLKDFQAYPETLASTASEPITEKGAYVLTTDIVGEINATTYLIVGPGAEDHICQQLLPATMVGQEEMRQAMLNEIDNIIIAALVTKYSNLLDVSIHGHVPNIEKYDVARLNELLENENAKNPAYAFRVNTSAFKARFSIEVLCFFNETIVPAIKNFDYDKAFVGRQEEKKEKSGAGFFKKLFT